MTRPLFRSLLLSLAAAGGLFAQDLPLPTGAVPVVSASLPNLSGQVGGPTVDLDLTGHFGLNTARSTFVRFDMTFGKVDIEVLEDLAPQNAANFLALTRAGYYDNTIIHRAVDFSDEDFYSNIVQGGEFSNVDDPQPIEDFGNVPLEISIPNARGTIAMARIGGQPNSANTSWFFNVNDNSEILGVENDGGYSVFGKVVGSGMKVLDQIALIDYFQYNLTFQSIPLRFYSGGVFTTNNFVKVFTVKDIPVYPSSNDDEAVLTFSATSSNAAVVSVAVEGSTLTLTPGVAGDATVTVAAETSSGDRIEGSFTFSSGGLVISAQPEDQSVAVGGSATLSVTAPAASGTNTYQWYFYRSGMSGPQAIAGATGATYTDNNVQNADMGAYFVRVTNGDTTLESEAALLTTTGGSSRLANLSTRGRIAAGGELTPGFVLGGSGAKQLLVRAVGPTLMEDFGQTGYITNPSFEVIPQGSATVVETSDDWGSQSNAAEIRTVSSSLGAFPLVEGGADAALLKSLPLPNAANSNGYSVRVKNLTAGEAGLAIAEVYDPDLNSPQRLVNVSALGFSGTGADALTPGFVISGTGAKTMLIRVVGPSLEAYGVTGRMADPRLRVVPLGQSFTVASNDNWSGTAELKAAFASTGAFQFSADNSLDAAVLVRLPPGGYSVVVAGANGGTGNVIVEAYEVE